MPTTGPMLAQPIVAPVSVANQQAPQKPLAPIYASDTKQEPFSHSSSSSSHPPPYPPTHQPPTQMAAPPQNGFPPRSARPEPDQRVPRKLLPSNSTSSLFVTSAITNPDLDELVLSVATMLHCQMVRDEEASEQRKMMCAYFQEEAYTGKPPHKTIPDADTIYAFLRDVFEVGEFHAECAIILLVYINRLIGLIDLPLTPSNWKPVTVTALIIAQKVWDDNPLANADFSILYPALNVKQINALELKFLLLLQYKLTVTASLYARYYFELRTICDSPDMRTACKKPMTRVMAERAENRSKQASEQAQREKRLAVTKGGKFRSITAEDFALPDQKLIIS